ncbi:MAG: putative DNA-binding domain-containing protein [Alphaproteobacteria bacterium]|nr:putative DNA-binding domain-containing protein [Alphaproteobacteria bacterium]
MTALARLQAEFRAWMQQAPVAPPDRRTSVEVPGEAIAPDALRARVLDTRKADREILLGVYREAYALRLIEALQTDYPGLLALVGPDDFDTMARAYIAAHPSHHPSVRWFGRDVAAFLAATPPFSDTPAAAEMARFEWALGEAFDAADAEPLTFDDVVALPPDAWTTLRLSFVPSLRRLTLRHQVPQAWLQRDSCEPGDLDVPPAVDPDNPVGRPGVEWLIWRTAPDADTQFRSTEADEAWMLDAARGGMAFPDLCDGLSAFAPAGEETTEAWAAQRAAGLLRAWVDAGCIVAADAT